MAVETEFSLRLPNSPGALADLCGVLAGERVNILAFALETSGQVRLVVDNVVRTEGTLREHRHRCAKRDVLMVQVADTAGALLPIVRLLAGAGVNVEYAYSGGARSGRSHVVIGVDDPIRAASVAGV